jgi:tetratricopeptide (TPR) repeat protein
MKNLVLLLLCLVFFSSLLAADRIGVLFQEANDAYQSSNYERAIALYDSIMVMGFESAALYYNLGNAHYKIGNVSSAILNYERALKLNPGHKDASFNLRLANLNVVDNIEQIPDLLLRRWGKGLLNSQTSGQWAIVFVVFLWITLFAAGLLLYSNQLWGKRIAFISGIVTLVLTIVSLSLALSKRNLEIGANQAIIFSQNAYVKSAPDGQSTDLFILHEGVKVNVLEEEAGWTRIQLADGKEGWIPADALERI